MQLPLFYLRESYLREKNIFQLTRYNTDISADIS